MGKKTGMAAVLDLPAPKGRGDYRTGRPPKYPWAELEVGKSFLAKQDRAGSPTIETMRGAAYVEGLKRGIKLSVSQYDATNIQVYRSE